MERQIVIGHIYKHFKNKYYIVTDIVNDCESNNDDEYKKIVIYRALYGDNLTWARPLEMFASEVDREKYPDVKQRYRFEEVKIHSKTLRLIQSKLHHQSNLIKIKLQELVEEIESNEESVTATHLTKCCICGKTVDVKESHNPWPIGPESWPGTVENRCCLECNLQIVAPARIKMSTMSAEDAQGFLLELQNSTCDKLIDILNM